MADEKKSKGRGKKILIGALILALIVAVVVILVVALPKGKTAQENLNAISSISMADNEDTKADYQAFSTKIGSTAGVQYYSDEVASVLELTVVVDKVVDFYNEYAPLCERIKNERAINDALSNIKASQKQLSSILVSAKAETTEGYTHIQNVWINYRSEFTYQLNQYQTLLNCLNKTYHTCLGQTMVVNEASRLVLNTIDSYMSVICEMFESLVAKDVKGSKEINYSLGSIDAKVDAFTLFVDGYLGGQERTFISRFYSSSSENYSLLNSFFEVFGQTNLENVIQAIDYEGDELESLYTNEEVIASIDNADKILSIVKSFIKGGLSA